MQTNLDRILEKAKNARNRQLYSDRLIMDPTNIHERIFPISNGCCIKLTRSVFTTESNIFERNKDFEILFDEYFIAKNLYEEGISVPKPIGFFDVIVELREGFDILGLREKFELCPAFVMEYISDAVLLDDLISNHSPYAPGLVAQMNLEITKAEDKGFGPIDSGLHNAIWSKARNKIYLIDFEYWSIRE